MSINSDNFNLIEKTIESNPESDEPDIIEFVKILIRKKKLLIGLTAIGMVVGTTFGLSQKKVWQGDFQVVLSDTQNKNLGKSSFDPDSLSINGLFDQVNSGKKGLRTEVEILKSSSILMPIYQFKKDSDSKSGISKTIRYKLWFRKNLKVGLIKGTSVLNVNYKDTNKDVILPILNKISDAYQKYSRRDRIKSIDNKIKYIDGQLKIFNKKSSDSARSFQEFAIEQDLNPYPLKSYEDSKEAISSTASISALRFQSRIQIRDIDELLKILEEPGIDLESFLYVGRTIRPISQLFESVDDIDSLLSEAKASYKENDPYIVQLQNQRNSQINMLKSKTINYLKSEKINLLSKERASDRPKDIFLKYNELLNQSIKDLNTLDQLDSEKRYLALRQAESKEPWQLITKPTIDNDYLSPSKKRVLSLSFIFSFFFGACICVFVERKEGFVFSEKEFQRILKFPLLIDLTNQSSIDDDLEIFVDKLYQETQNSAITIITLGQINNSFMSRISNKIKILLDDQKVNISKSLLNNKNTKSYLLFLDQGTVKRKELIYFLKRLKLQDKPVFGWVLINSNQIDV